MSAWPPLLSLCCHSYRQPGVLWGWRGEGKERGDFPPLSEPPSQICSRGLQGEPFSSHQMCTSRFGLTLSSFRAILEGWGERKTHHCFNGTLNSGVFLPTTIYFLFACLLFGFFWLHCVACRILVPKDQTPGPHQ